MGKSNFLKIGHVSVNVLNSIQIRNSLIMNIYILKPTANIK